MANTRHYTHCPVCGSAAIHPVLKAKDHTVSQEVFEILSCDTCTVRFTQDVPDASSIGPYYKSEEYISHTNTSKGLVNRLYQWVRKRTLQQKRKLIEKQTGIKNGNVLDLGCGTGAFVYEMKTHGWQVTGLEPDADARAVGKQVYGIELGDITQFHKLPQGTYDAITLWHVLEHVHELQDYVAQLKKLLRKEGQLFIAVPNYTSKDASLYREYWAAYDVPRHLYHFSPASMQRLMEQNGLKVIAFKPMWYDSFYVSLLSSKYRYGKTKLVHSFLNGLRSNLGAMGDVKKCSSVIYVVKRDE